MLLAIILAGCNAGEQQNTTVIKNDTVVIQDTATVEKEKVDTTISEKTVVAPQGKTYSNQRFKDVTVEKTGEHKFLIKGKSQIFEANFNWVVEDGHRELKKGFEMTSAGAPEWGKFMFPIEVEKELFL